VKDLTPPVQYGKASPLREDVLIGEEIFVTFTEDIDCEKPYYFDMEFEIDGTVFIDDYFLQISCQGNKIGFHINLARCLELEDIIGKVMDVRIGALNANAQGPNGIYDLHGNAMVESTISFSKTIADLDTERAAMSFTLSMHGGHRKLFSEDGLKQKIVSSLDIDSEHIHIERMTFDDKSGEFRSAVKILPLSGDRRKLRQSNNVKTFDLFKKLRDISEYGKDDSRKLSKSSKSGDNGDRWSFTMSNVKILPSADDLEKFNISASEPVLTEEELHSVTGDGDDNAGERYQASLLAKTEEMQMEAKRYEHEEREKFEKELKRLDETQSREEKREKEMEQMFMSISVFFLIGFGAVVCALLFLLKKKE